MVCYTSSVLRPVVFACVVIVAIQYVLIVHVAEIKGGMLYLYLFGVEHRNYTRCRYCRFSSELEDCVYCLDGVWYVISTI